MKTPHPMQPVEFDPDGTARFKQNALVRFLVDWSRDCGMGLNGLALLPGISNDDWTQLAQLIGYSVSGAGELSYFDRQILARADREVEKRAAQRGPSRRKSSPEKMNPPRES